MPDKNEDLHGNAPDKSDVALLLIDVIDDLDFPEGNQPLRFALPMARQIAALKRRARLLTAERRPCRGGRGRRRAGLGGEGIGGGPLNCGRARHATQAERT
jgi:hypothetical protein